MKRLLIKFGLILLSTIVLMSCSNQKDTISIEVENNDLKTETVNHEDDMVEHKIFLVGVSNASNDDFFDNLRILKLKPLDDVDDSIDLIYQDAKMDVTTQLAQIDGFIEEGVDAAVIVPVDYELISSGILKLNDAGIPVITLGVKTSEGINCYIGSPNIDAGRMQAEFITKVLPYNAKIFYIEGDQNRFHSQERKEGFLEVLGEKRSDIELIDSKDGVYREDLGYEIVNNWLVGYSDFDAIVAANDLMALGAIKALKEHNMLDGKIILGIDASNPEALQAVKDGELTMTIYQDAESQATQCMNVLKSLRNGMPLPEDIIIPFKEVTIENISDYYSEN